jgi:precorrin-8X/cobalt-precorrin-8 methylmutase
MVRHYHQLGLLPPALRSASNYRLYTQKDVQQLQRIVALKQQGFQLSHIRELLATDAAPEGSILIAQLQQEYQSVIQQLARLRQTASALEGLLGRDRHCQALQLEAITQLRQLQAETTEGLEQLHIAKNQVASLQERLDAVTHAHPEVLEESLAQLLPLSHRSEIEVDLLRKLVLAGGDVSLVHFVRLSPQAIATARHTLKAGCSIIGDVPTVVAALDGPRLAHLGCHIETLINNPHITSATEAEQEFWHQKTWKKHLHQVSPQSILVIGYAPSVLMAACTAIEQGQIQPALIIGMPIGFSHAPAAKRRLMQLDIPYITVAGTIGGGLLAATTLNALAESLIEKPNCHCYLNEKP